MPPSSAGRQVLRVRRTSEAEEDGGEHGLGELLSTTVDAAAGGDEPRGRCGGRVTIVRARGKSYAVSARSFGCVPAEHQLRRPRHSRRLDHGLEVGSLIVCGQLQHLRCQRYSDVETR